MCRNSWRTQHVLAAVNQFPREFCSDFVRSAVTYAEDCGYNNCRSNSCGNGSVQGTTNGCSNSHVCSCCGGCGCSLCGESNCGNSCGSMCWNFCCD